MELKEVTIMDSRDFLDRHLSVTAKTMVKSVKDFDEAASKLKEVYGEPLAIVDRTLIEAYVKITPLSSCLKWNDFHSRLGERILVLQSLLSLLSKLKGMSERSNDFKEIIFHKETTKQILQLVPSNVRTEFIRECRDKKIMLNHHDGSYYMAFHNFIHNEYVIGIRATRDLPTDSSELKDVVEQSMRDAEGVGEFHEETLSEDESCKSPSAREEDAIDDDVK